MKKSILFTTCAAIGLSLLMVPQTAHAAGFVQADNGVKYQNDDGTFLSDSWIQIGQSIYRLGPDGLVQTGWIQVGDLWYFMDATGVCTNPNGSAAPTPEIPAAADPAPDPVPAVNIFAAAGWLPYTPAYESELQQGMTKGYIGFDGIQYWIQPDYKRFLDNLRSITQPLAAQAQVNVGASGSAAPGSGWVPYSTSSPSTLANALARGDVIYRNGQYWASPDFVNRLSNENVVYVNDIAPAPPADRYALANIKLHG